MRAIISLAAGLFLCVIPRVALPATYTDTFVPGLNMIANHVNTGANTMTDIFGTSLPDGTAVYLWDKNTATFVVDQYDATVGGWILNLTLNPGEGAFLQNPTAGNIVYTYNGAAPVNGPVTLPLNQFCLLSHKSVTALPATFQDIVGSLPQVGFCTRLYRWNRSLQRYDLYVSTGGPWNPSAPSIPRGESVFIIKASPDNTPPTLVNATMNIAQNTIVLEFSEPMNPSPAQFIGNYSLSGGPGSIMSAVMYPPTTPPPVDTKFVQLNTVGLNGGFTYKLNISGLTDLCGNVIDSCTQVGLNCSPPANDSCANATVAVIGPNPGTTSCSTTDGASVCDNICPGGDVWFQYTPPCNGTLTFDTCGSPMDTILSVWNGCPTSFAASEVACDDDSCAPLQSTVTLPVTSCGTYYVRISGSGGAFGNFTLNVAFTPSAPPNNACGSPIVLGVGGIPANGVFPFNTCNATTDGPGAQPIVQDIWFRYTPTCSGPIYVSTCGSSFDTALAVYAGSCAGTLMGFNNNATSGVCSGTLQSFLTFNAISGTQYFIRVGSTPGAAPGCGQLVVLGPNPPVGTCPPGVPPLGAGVNVLYTRLFEVTGNSAGTPWAWSISSPCCYWEQNLNVPGVLPVNSPASALVAAFVASINAPCPPFPPSPPWFNGRLNAIQLAGKFMGLEAYGCNNDIMFSVGPAGTLAQNQCVVPNPADFLPTAGPCSFNPPIAEIPLSKQDCNRNGIDDLIDILQGTSTDANGNRIPDECEQCERPHFVSTSVRQTVKPGQRAVFNSNAKGQILSYQWLLNGNPVSGATDDKLVIDPVRITDAGEYQVAVNYACGQLRSIPVRLTVTGDTLQIRFRDSRVEVSWDATDVFLQSASQVTGTWTTLSNAVSPHIISQPIAQEFFRLIGR